MKRTLPDRERLRAPSPSAGGLKGLLGALRSLVRDVVEAEGRQEALLASMAEPGRASARNLVHYLELRRHDIRALQDELAETGLSSLGRAEAHVLWTLETVLGAVARLSGRRLRGSFHPAPVKFRDGRRVLEERTDALLGPRRADRDVRIMVTMPAEAARDYALIHDLLAHGMDAVRINCAHDGPEAWTQMIEKIRRAERETGRRCPILMDLGGPKLRTGRIADGPPVASWRPVRDPFGRVTAPARIWLYPSGADAPAPMPASAELPVPADWLAGLKAGDSIKLTDTRGAGRTLKIAAAHGAGRWAEGTRAAYVTTGTHLVKGRTGEVSAIGELPPAEPSILLRAGDTLLVTRDPAPGRPAVLDTRGRIAVPATVPCTLPEVFGTVKPGERIWIDDGKIGGVVRKASSTQLHVEILHARPKGDRLRSDRGINLPDSGLALPALTAKDEVDLEFVARHADLVGLSFVQRTEDVDELKRRLEALGAAEKGVVLKIETRQAFEELPSLLIAALRMPRAGVMIARGDLLVECGFERLAEVQEEILWLCEAAHLPVIWATQVLEGLAQKGLPSRAEITDAAMGERAECVMLNKGPHIVETVRVLDSILQRMQAHQKKKSPRLRRLNF